MEIKVKRIARKDTYTIGHLYIDGKYFCDTCEDKDRGLTDSMTLEDIAKIKVYGKTAIPTGRYRVTMTYSNKFGKVLPLVNGVKGFDGIRIHSGNTAEDSLGCVLLGKNKAKGAVLESRVTCNEFNKIINQVIGKEAVYLTIV